MRGGLGVRIAPYSSCPSRQLKLHFQCWVDMSPQSTLSMRNEDGLQDSEVVPFAIYTPAKVPAHWTDKVKADIERDVALGMEYSRDS